MLPIVALTWSASGIAAAISLNTLSNLALYSAVLALALWVETRSSRPVLKALQFSLPFALPLAIVHGIINPSFPGKINYLFISIRPDGLTHATEVTLRIFLLTLVAVAWREVNPDTLFNDAVRARLPLGFIVVIAVASATVSLLDRRIRSVHLAQQARGVRTGPSLLTRISALTSLVIPVISATLIESSSRGEMVSTRGLGRSRLMTMERETKLKPKNLILTSILLAVLLYLWAPKFS